MTGAGILYIVLGIVTFAMVVFFAYQIAKRGTSARGDVTRHSGPPPPRG